MTNVNFQTVSSSNSVVRQVPYTQTVCQDVRRTTEGKSDCRLYLNNCSVKNLKTLSTNCCLVFGLHHIIYQTTRLEPLKVPDLKTTTTKTGYPPDPVTRALCVFQRSILIAYYSCTIFGICSTCFELELSWRKAQTCSLSEYSSQGQDGPFNLKHSFGSQMSLKYW